MKRKAMDRSPDQCHYLVNQSIFISPVVRPAGQEQGGAAT